MTTSEIFIPFILCGGFAMIGGFAPLAAAAVSGFKITDADQSGSEFQRPISRKGRTAFISLFLIAPFVFGAMWGLIHLGAFSESLNEPLSYAAAMFVGMISNSIVIKLNDMSIQQISNILIKGLNKQ